MPFGDYKHMGRADTFLWERFNRLTPQWFTRPTYDMRVGEGADLPPDLDEPYRLMATRLSQKRIDVFAYHDADPYIIEIKPYPGASAVGQLVTYRTLYALDHPARPVPLLALIAARVDRDDQAVLDRANVRTYITPVSDAEMLAIERGEYPQP